MKSGIYKISNIINNRIYIGSTYNISARFSAHKSSLRKNKHYNYKLQNDWNKSKGDNFIFEIIELCTKHMCLQREQFYIEKLNPYYNISLEASSPMSNRKHNPETIKKLKGRKPWNKGIKRTHEEKQKMSENRKGIPYPEYAKENLRKRKGSLSYWYGKKLSTETRRKISENQPKCRVECSNGKVYNSQLEASRDLNIRQGHISEHLKGKRTDVKGYKFKRF